MFDKFSIVQTMLRKAYFATAIENRNVSTNKNDDEIAIFMTEYMRPCDALMNALKTRSMCENTLMTIGMSLNNPITILKGLNPSFVVSFSFSSV